MSHYEFFKLIADLLDTMEEGFIYIKSKMEVSDIEGTMLVFTDLIAAFNEIEESLTPILEEFPDSDLLNKSKSLGKAFSKLVNEYEKGDFSISQTLNNTLEPAFKKWKEEIQSIITPHIFS